MPGLGILVKGEFAPIPPKSGPLPCNSPDYGPNLDFDPGMGRDMVNLSPFIGQWA